MTGSARFPDFLIIGAVKAGTTWLWNLLLEHPDLYLPANRKELRFFNAHWSEGVDWYASWFTGAAERVTGEVSPEYLHFPAAAERIRSVLPAVKLIAVLRDPVERAYSHVRMHCKRGAISPSDIDDAVLRPFFVEPGLYGKHLDRYLNLFCREQMFVLRFENLMEDTDTAISNILAFLEVERDVQLPTSMRAANRARHAPRSNIVQGLLISLNQIAQRSVYGSSLWDKVARSRPAIALRGFNQGEEYPSLSRDARHTLADLYDEDVRRLSDLLGDDFTDWLERNHA